MSTSPSCWMTPDWSSSCGAWKMCPHCKPSWPTGWHSSGHRKRRQCWTAGRQRSTGVRCSFNLSKPVQTSFRLTSYFVSSYMQLYSSQQCTSGGTLSPPRLASPHQGPEEEVRSRHLVRSRRGSSGVGRGQRVAQPERQQHAS